MLFVLLDWVITVIYSGVNFTNILLAAFCMKKFWAAFLYAKIDDMSYKWGNFNLLIANFFAT